MSYKNNVDIIKHLSYRGFLKIDVVRRYRVDIHIGVLDNIDSCIVVTKINSQMLFLMHVVKN